MLDDPIKNLVIKTAEEHKHSLGSDFRLVLKEINQLDDISLNERFENNGAEFFFSLNKGEKKYKVSILVNKEDLENIESFIGDRDKQKVVKLSVSAFWETPNKRKELFEYYTELIEEENTPILKYSESHDIISSNCEDLRDKLIPSCEIISFLDILLLSLFRFTVPQLIKHLDWDKNIPIRSSLIEHIASDECFRSSDDTSTDSESENVKKKKVARRY